jgi:NAD+ kinase
MEIALYGKNIVNNHNSFLEKLLKHLNDLQVQILIFEQWQTPIETAKSLGIPYHIFSDYHHLQSADYLLSIGGDGTLLDTLPLVHNTGIPVIGINIGKLGFLSAVSRDEIETVLDCIIHKKIMLEPRTLLELKSDDYNGYKFALNEISILKQLPASMLSIKVNIDGEFLNNYWADGLIVATPTGSTAYSLSCGGPILMPSSENFVITPIATHNLTVRPVVVPDTSKIEIEVDKKTGLFLLGLDSRIIQFATSKKIALQRADFKLNLGRLPDRNFCTTLRAKLTWGHDIRN